MSMSKWKSRKLWAAVASVATIVLVNLGVPEGAATAITEAVMTVAGAYLLGQSAVDALDALKRQGHGE